MSKRAMSRLFDPFASVWRRPARPRAASRKRRQCLPAAALERLEDRMLLSAQELPVGLLDFSGDFENGEGESQVGTGTIYVGFTPTGAEAFNPLLEIDGKVTLYGSGTNSTTFTIEQNGEDAAAISLFTLAANPTVWKSAQLTTLDADAITSVAGQALDADNSQGVTVVADIPFFTTNIGFVNPPNDETSNAQIDLQGYFDFSHIDLSALKVGVSGDNEIEVASDTKDVTLTGVDASLSADFTVAGVEVTGMIGVSYADANQEFTFSGGAKATVQGLEGESDSSLGVTLGMGVAHGDIESIELGITGSFDVYALEIEPDDLTFEYSTADAQFVMYGDVTAKIPNGEANDDNSDSTSLTARFGTSDNPGLIVDTSGTVSRVDISIFGTLNVLGFVLESPQTNPATFQYVAADDLYELSGTITAPKFWNATITMGSQAQPGIKIQDGKWSVDDLEIAISDVKLGAFTINDFDVKYDFSGSDVDLDFGLDVTFPQGWDVGAEIDTIFNTKTKAFEINDVFVKASGLEIAIGDTGLFVTEIDASLQNIFQPSNLIVSGDITVEFGDDVTIFGETARFFLAKGGFTVDKDMLELDAEVWVGAVTSGGKTSGLLGTGTGTVVLDWADQNYSMDLNASLYDGTFTFQEKFEFSAGDPLEVLISAKADVNVPHGIPLIGGKELGELDFLFKYQAPEEKGGQAEGFVAAWTRIDLVFTHVETGIEYDFESNKVKTIGSGTINALQKQTSSETTTYVYSQPFTTATGATQATLAVNWDRTFASPPKSATVSVELPDGTTVIDQNNFSAANGLKLITTSSGGNDLSSSTQTNVGVVNSAVTSKTLTGTVTNGSNLVTLSGSTDGLNGWAVSGTGIPAGTTVVVVDENTLKMSQIATSSATDTSLTFTDPFLALPLVSNQDFTRYTLKVTFTSDSAPINPSVTIASITEGPDQMAQITFTGGVPSTLRVGDTIDISGSNISTYNTTGMFMVTEITSDGVVINQPFDKDATGGTMTGWTLPQFSATYHIPQPTILVSQVDPEVSTSKLTVTMPVHVSSALAGGTTVDVYIDEFDHSLGANQNFNGLLLASGVPLGQAVGGGSQDQYMATTTVNLAQSNLGLLPIEYYLYAVVNDGTNTPVTSTLTSDDEGSFLEVFENDPAVDGFVENQQQQRLAGWTVFVDTNGNGQLDPGEPTATTTSNGFYQFYSDQISIGPVDLVLQKFDPTAFTFPDPPPTGYTIVDGGRGLSTQVNWDGTDAVGANFTVTQFSSIAGVLTLSDGTTTEGVGGWTVFLDANGNGQLDPGETSTLTKANGSYAFTNFNAAAITSITSSSDLSAPTTVLNLAGAVPTALKVGDTITVSGSSVAAYNTTHTITAINAQSVVTDVAYTAAATGGLLTGPDVTETVALAVMNGSAATYAFAPDQVQGTLVLDGSGGPNALKHVGTLENGATVGTADSFSIEDHPNAGTDNQILNLPTGATVDVANTSDLEPGTGAFSAAGWFRAGDLNGSAALAGLLESGATSGGWEFGITQDSLQFSQQVPVGVHSKPEFIAMADFNGDGKPDLAVANAGSNTVSILLNTTEPGAGAPSFVQANNIQVGTTPTFLAVADFNGDGKPDLAVANSGTSTISVTLNRVTPGSTTSATFSTPREFTVGNGPNFIAVADINRDGKPDLAVANAGANSVSVLLNETGLGSSTPGFSSQSQLVIANGPTFIAVDDYNGDGNPDLAVANADSGNVSILLNTTGAGASSPSFAEKLQLDVGNTPNFIAVTDINRDGKPDLAVANSEGTAVSVRLNTTSPGSTLASFADNQQLAVGSKPDFIAIGDFNTDGIPDLAVSNAGSNDVSVLFNKTAAGGTSASFENAVQFAVGTNPNFITVEDFDLDGKPDLVVANSGGTDLSALRNETGSGASTPTFASAVPLAAGQQPSFIATADFNGDGKPDLAAANSGGSDVSILLNSSLLVGKQASFAADQRFGFASAPQGVPFQADFNVDGKPDFAFPYSDNGSGIAVLLNGTAPGASTASFAGGTFAFGSSIFGPIGVAADFNGDGKPDLAGALQDTENRVAVRFNTTEPGAMTPEFGPEQLFAIHHPATYAVTADVNGDGKPDIIVAAPSGTDAGFTILLNTTAPGSTTPSFTSHTINSGVPQPDFIVTADFNGDGRPDLAFGDVNDAHVSVLINTTSPGSGSPSFASARTFGVHAGVLEIATPDFNGDGKPDLAVGNIGSNVVSVLLNTTSPGSATVSFTDHVNFELPGGGIPEGLEVADFNGDGKPDLAVGNYNGTVSVFLNKMAPGATAPSFLITTHSGGSGQGGLLTVADVNGDGRPDLAVGNNANSTVNVLLNRTIPGAGSVDLATPISVGGGISSGSNLIAVTDLNGDGKSDLAIGLGFRFGGGDQLSVLLNTEATDAVGPYVELVENSSSGSGSLAFADPLTTIDPDTWYHLAFTYDPNADANGNGTGAGTLKLYVNGALTATSASRGTLPAGADISSPSGVDFLIGDRFDGFLDDISVWGSALTATQVQALYNGTTSPSYMQTAPTNPATYMVTLSGATDLAQGKNFTVTESSTVSGTVQANALGNTQLVPVALPAAGWTVELLDGNGQVVASTTTNAAGGYVFAGLDVGTYSLRLVLPDGWRQTAAANDGFSIDLGPGDLLERLDFTAAQIGQINGTLVDDIDGDGQRDPGDPGRDGATVYLDLNGNGRFDDGIDRATTTVDAGAYAFAAIDDGAYQLLLVPVPGRLLTGPSDGLYEVTIAGGIVQPDSDTLYDFLTTVNHPPVITQFTSNSPVFQGETFQIQAAFTDSDSLAPLNVATVDWGDGTTSAGMVTESDGTGTVTAEHVYAQGGYYTVTMTVIDGADDTVFTVSNPLTAEVTSDASGWWIINGQAAQILQLDGVITFINEHNGPSAGRFAMATQVVASDWGNLVGNIVDDEIQWANGSVWDRVPDLTPTGTIGGSSPVLVQQLGIDLKLTNERGEASTGHFISSTELVTDNWGGLSGTVVGDEIVWANGTEWSLGDAANGAAADVSGAWAIGGQDASVLQFGETLLFVNEHGGAAQGTLIDSTHVVASGWNNLGGTIDPATRQILWDNGTVWGRVPVLNRNENWHTDDGRPTAISQMGERFLFTNENGIRSEGRPHQLVGVVATDWDAFGQVDYDNAAIHWDNSTNWIDSEFGARDEVFANVNDWPWLI